MSNSKRVWPPYRTVRILLGILALAVSLATGARADVHSDRIQEHITQGFGYIYNLEYERSEQEFKKLVEFAPDDPAGYAYQALNILLRELLKGRELGLENFTSASYFNKTEKRKIDPRLERQFRELSEQALEKARQQAQKDPKNTRALYFLGTTYGIIASYEKAINRSTVAALTNGRKCVDFHRQAIKIDPNFYDSYLSIGLYDYITGIAHWSFRWIIRLAGYRGDKQRGLAQLKMVAEKGTNNRNDAKLFLAILYVWEMRFEDALSYMLQLQKQFPRNYLLQLDTGSLYRLLKQDDDAIQLYDDILRKIKAKTPNFHQLGAEQVHYRLGTIYLDRRNTPAAIEHFTKVLQRTSGNEEIATLAHLNLGAAYDLSNERVKAQEQYKIVLQREDVKNSQYQARKYLQRPYVGLND